MELLKGLSQRDTAGWAEPETLRDRILMAYDDCHDVESQGGGMPSWSVTILITTYLDLPD